MPGILAGRPFKTFLLLILTLANVLFLGFQFREILSSQYRPSLESAGLVLKVVGDHLVVEPPFPFGSDGSGEQTPHLPLRAGDRILALQAEGRTPIEAGGLLDWVQALRQLQFGAPWSLLIERPGGEPEPKRMWVPMPPIEAPEVPPAFPWVDLSLKVLLPLLCLVTGLFIGLARREDPRAFTAAMLFLSFANASPARGYIILPPGLREAELVLAVGLFSGWSYLFYRFFSKFPVPSPLERKFPRLKGFLLVFPILFATWNFIWTYTQGVSLAAFHSLDRTLGWLDITLDLGFVCLFGAGFVAIATNLKGPLGPDDRRRLAILGVGSLGVLPAMALYLHRVVLRGPDPEPWVLSAAGAAVGLFPLSFAYAVVKHRVFGIRPIVRRGLRYALLSKGFLFLEGAIVFVSLFYVAGPLLARVSKGQNLSVAALITAALTMVAIQGLKRANRSFMLALDTRFFREAYDGARILKDLVRETEQFAQDPSGLARLVLGKIHDSLHPDQVCLFIRGDLLSKLPLQGVLARRALMVLSMGQPEDFYCFCRMVRGTSADEPPAVSETCPGPFLPSLSRVGRRLAAMVGTEPAALDLVDGELISWPQRPSGEEPHEALERERALLREMNARLFVPLAAHRQILGFVSLGEKRSEEPYSREDKELLLTVARQAGAAFSYAGSVRQDAERLRLKQDMEMARRVQERLLPQRRPTVEGLEYVGHCRPALEVGGDCFDFIELPDGRLGIAVGDVAGKGAAAALLMASLQAMLRVHAGVHGDDVEHLAMDVNKQLCSITEPNRFASLFYGVFDPPGRTLTYVNAGHNPPLLLRAGLGRSLGAGAVQMDRAEVRVERPEWLHSTGPVLGVVKEGRYRRSVLRMEPGDTLVIYTDGIAEAANSTGELYGEARLEDSLLRHRGLAARDLAEALFEDVARFAGEAPQGDDMTLVVAIAARGGGR
ncbi:MAG: SpoIIE family protein phosphatase [Acidobacteriota bacterium]